jgi:hypothetical protein
LQKINSELGGRHLQLSNMDETMDETQIFHHAKKYSSKNPLKETKILPDIITLYN